MCPTERRFGDVRLGSYLKTAGLQRDEYVLFLGRFSPEKNCHLLIEAFERLNTSMKLVLAGGSSHTDDYIRGLHQHKSDRVIFLNWLSGDDLEEVLMRAALFVLPSDVEGLSLALLDAMGSGVCVLASDVAENVEALGDAGYTFKRRDRDDLQRMLEMLLSDKQLREVAGQRGQERVRNHYLWDAVTARLSEIYASVAVRRTLVLPQKTARLPEP